MTFQELKEEIENEFGIIKLADIAREFDVSPQVINNWKARDQVPYKYVKIFKSKIKEKQIESDGGAKVFYEKSYSYNENDVENDLSFSDMVILYIGYALNYKYIILTSVTLCYLGAAIYLKYISIPLYQAEASILPINAEKSSSLGSLAGDLGISLGSKSSKVDLSSSQLVPEIVNSRKLARSMLSYEFETRKFGKNKKLISIVLDDTISTEFTEKQIRHATKRVRGMISVRVQKRSPILILRSIGSDKYFIPDLLDTVIYELSNMVSKYRLSQNIEKRTFIGSRLNEIQKSLKDAEDEYEKFKQANRKIFQSPSLIIEEQRLLREIELQSQVYITLRTEFQLAEIEEAGNSNLIQVLDEPEIPLKKISPKPNQIYFAGIILGSIISMSIIFLKEWLNDNGEEFKNVIFKNE